MRKIAIKLLMVLSVSSQVVLAQNIGTRNMNQDSTSLVPNAQMMSIQNSINTTTSTSTSQAITNGRCGADNATLSFVTPTALCTSGIATTVTLSGNNYSWSCIGSSNGSNASCSSTRAYYGSCGSDNGKTLSSSPTNLCASGTPSSVSLSGTSYAWSCNGNYGAPVNCSATAILITMCTLGARDYISLGLSGSWPSSVTYKGMSVPVPGLGGTNYISGSTGRYSVFNIPGGGSNPMVGATLEITCIP